MTRQNVKEPLERLKLLGVDIGSIIDVGVNESTPSLMSAFPQHQHVLIEPIDDYFTAIKRNYSRFKFELLPYAANDVDGVVYLESEKKYGGRQVSHSRIVAEPNQSTREVKSLRLDTMLAGIELIEPLLLKIDVEGADVPEAILRGAPDTLRRSSCVVIEMTVPKFMDRARLIEAAGFQLFDLFDACYYRDTLWQVDAVFVRSELIAANQRLRPMSVLPFDPSVWQPMKPHVSLGERVRRFVARKLR
jgi:FkbM family methyltransferase